MALSYHIREPGKGIITGLSTDTKPSAPNDCVFLEEDTGKIYLRESSVWNEKLNSSYAATDDARLSDARTPLSHTHPLATDVTGSLSLITQTGQLPGATGISGILATANLSTDTWKSGYFLRGDQVWGAPSAGSVAASDVTGSLSLITQSGLLPLATGTTGTLAVASGGTGASSGSAAYTNLGVMSVSNLSGSISLVAQSGLLPLGAGVSGSLALVTNSGLLPASTGLSGSISLITQSGLLPAATGISGSISLITQTGLLPLATGTTGSLSLIAKSGPLPLATGTTGTLSVSSGGTGTSNSAGITALLDTFTSSLKGLAPSSGGGTTNFLRADGSWSPAGGSGPFTTVRKTGLDQGSSGTSLLNSVNQMDFTLAASSNYVFEYWVRYQTAAATTGLVLGIQTPASPVGVWMDWSSALAATGTKVGGAAIGSNTTLSIASGDVAAGGQQLAYVTGMVMNGSNAGTMALRWCSEVTGSMCTIKTGTMGRIMSIS